MMFTFATFHHDMAVLALATIAIVAFAVPAECYSQTVDWSFGTNDGGEKFDILQCQTVTFDWMSGGFHDVWEFPHEEAYDACDFSNAQEVAPASLTGSFTISDNMVTKRWFGSKVENDCHSSVDGGNMKIVVKIRPHLTQKYPEFECAGGIVDVVKSEETLKSCRKRCKRRRGCLAIEYDRSTQKCTAFNAVPTQGDANPLASCEIARTTCFKAPDTPPPTPAPQLPEPTPPAPTPPPEPAPTESVSDIARNRPVEVSSTYRNWQIYAPFRLVDGDSGTRWTSAYADNQWIIIDLGEDYDINRVVLGWEGAYALSYEIQASADKSTWTTVYSENNGNGGTDDITFASQSGRYVRMNLWTRATVYGFSLWDFEVYEA